MKTSNDIHGTIGFIFLVGALAIIVIFLGPTLFETGLKLVLPFVVSLFLLVKGFLLLRFYFFGETLHYHLSEIDRPFIIKKIIADDDNFVKIEVEESGICFVKFIDDYGQKINLSKLETGKRYVYTDGKLAQA